MKKIEHSVEAFNGKLRLLGATIFCALLVLKIMDVFEHLKRFLTIQVPLALLIKFVELVFEECVSLVPEVSELLLIPLLVVKVEECHQKMHKQKHSEQKVNYEEE